MISKLWRWLNSEDVLDSLTLGFFCVVCLVIVFAYAF